MQQRQLTTAFDVFDVVKMLRKHRQAMVQTVDQYVFVYKAVLDLVREVLDSLKAGPGAAAPALPAKPATFGVDRRGQTVFGAFCFAA